LIGGDGLPALAGFGVDALNRTPSFRRVAIRQAGEDVLESYVRGE